MLNLQIKAMQMAFLDYLNVIGDEHTDDFDYFKFIKMGCVSLSAKKIKYEIKNIKYFSP